MFFLSTYSTFLRLDPLKVKALPQEIINFQLNSTNDNSIAYYNNIFIELIIVLGMIIASLPFTLYLSSLHKGLKAFKDSQLIIFLLLICFFTFSLTTWNYYESNIAFLPSLRLFLSLLSFLYLWFFSIYTTY